MEWIIICLSVITGLAVWITTVNSNRERRQSEADQDRADSDQDRADSE